MCGPQALKDPIIILLIVAALISTVLGVAIPEEREHQAWTEGIAIWVAILVVTLVAATQVSYTCVLKTLTQILQ